jgi:hypothetical protein
MKKTNALRQLVGLIVFIGITSFQIDYAKIMLKNSLA